MNQTQCYILVNLFMSKPAVTAREIRKEMGCTGAELDLLMQELNAALQDKGAIVCDVNHQIYSLNITDSQKFRDFSELLDRGPGAYRTQDERILYILEKMLLEDQYVRIDELSEELFVSPRQISNYLKNVREYLARYDLKLQATPHHGMRIKGTEMKRRICLASLYSNNLSAINHGMFMQEQRKNIDTIREIVSGILDRYHYVIFDTIFENLVIHLYVSLLRIKNGTEIKVSGEEPAHDVEHEIAEDIAEALGAAFQVSFGKDEIRYIRIHLECKRDYFDSSDYALNIPPEIGDLVIEFLGQIDMKYHLNLRNDFKLCMVLCSHFLSLRNRIRYGLSQSNPLLAEIKTNCLYEYEMAEEGVKIINEKYRCKLSEDEIAYIALDLRSATEKRYVQAKYRILLICSMGRGSSELLRLRFKEAFHRYIRTLDLHSVRESEGMELDSYDYIFSTVPVFVRTKTPVFRISVFLDKNDLHTISRVLQFGNHDSQVQDYFSEELFMGACDFKSKEEALERMTAYVKKHRDIPEEFLSSIMAREKVANTSFGNRAAFPHPIAPLTETTFVCVAVAKTPIKWTDTDYVQLILLTSIETSKNKNLQKFYEAVTKVINNQENVDLLISSPKYEIFYDIIFS